MTNQMDHRRYLDLLFSVDALFSLAFGVVALLTPHGIIQRIGGGEYSHSAHEIFRLYGCLRVAVGWIVLHVRSVDDGRFRRSVCESLFFCYLLQAMAVLRAQFTDRASSINWIAITILTLIGGAYGRFRFGAGGGMIKVYELPQNNKVMR